MLRNRKIKTRNDCERLASQIVKEIKWRKSKPVFNTKKQARHYLDKVAQFEPGISVAVRYYECDSALLQKFIRELHERYKLAKDIEQEYFFGKTPLFANHKDYDIAHKIYKLGLKEIRQQLRQAKKDCKDLPQSWLIYLAVDFSDLD